MSVATSTALALSAAIGAGATITSKYMESRSIDEAADKSTAATMHGDDLKKQATDEALAYQKQQDALAQARWEAAQRGNYAQYVSRVKAAQALGDTIGFHLPDPGPYVSSTVPASGTTPNAALPAGRTVANALASRVTTPIMPFQSAARPMVNANVLDGLSVLDVIRLAQAQRLNGWAGPTDSVAAIA